MPGRVIRITVPSIERIILAYAAEDEVIFGIQEKIVPAGVLQNMIIFCMPCGKTESTSMGMVKALEKLLSRVVRNECKVILHPKIKIPQFLHSSRYHLIALAIIVLIILLPNGFNIPRNDSGIFLYVGQRMLEGEVPYRDLWNNTPPIIYFINAIGLFVANGSVWGVVFLEFVAIYLSVIFGFFLIKRSFGAYPALFGSVGWLSSLSGILCGGNLAEEFALPCQFASLYLFYVSEKRGVYSWRGFVIGSLAAVSFLLKQNLIGIWLAIGIYILANRMIAHRWHRLGKDLGVILLGASFVLACVTIYFIYNNALGFLWDVSFKYNFAYSATSISSRFRSLLCGFEVLSTIHLILAFWGCAIFYVFCDNRISNDKNNLLILAIIALPIEFCLTMVSGYSYIHYYMAWLPVVSIIISFMVFVFADLLIQKKSYALVLNHFSVSTTKTFVIIMSILLICTIWILPMAKSISYNYIRNQKSIQEVIDYVSQTTKRRDSVLVWGDGGPINFLTKRHSPTRFFVQHPLVTKNYSSPRIIKEFTDDVISSKPKLIIKVYSDRLPPINLAERLEWLKHRKSTYAVFHLPTKNLNRFFGFVTSNYKLGLQIGNTSVYLYKGK